MNDLTNKINRLTKGREELETAIQLLKDDFFIDNLKDLSDEIHTTIKKLVAQSLTKEDFQLIIENLHWSECSEINKKLMDIVKRTKIIIDYYNESIY